MAGVAVRRRSRSQRPAQMRQRILESAVQCLVELGYAETTTLAVQGRAGVSRGALLHHFPTRDELVVAAVEHLFESVKADLHSQLRADVGEADRAGEAVELLWGSFRGPLFTAALDLWMAARTDSSLLAVLVPHERKLGHEIKALCRDLFGPRLSAHPRFDRVCELLVQAMRGEALSSVIRLPPARDGEFVAHLKEMVAVMLEDGGGIGVAEHRRPT